MNKAILKPMLERPIHASKLLLRTNPSIWMYGSLNYILIEFSDRLNDRSNFFKKRLDAFQKCEGLSDYYFFHKRNGSLNEEKTNSEINRRIQEINKISGKISFSLLALEATQINKFEELDSKCQNLKIKNICEFDQFIRENKGFFKKFFLKGGLDHREILIKCGCFLATPFIIFILKKVGERNPKNHLLSLLVEANKFTVDSLCLGLILFEKLVSLAGNYYLLKDLEDKGSNLGA